MNVSPRVLLYGLIAVALVASSLLFRSSTPVAEARCNNRPNHACTQNNDNVGNDNLGTLSVDNVRGRNDNNFNNNFNGDNVNECEINLNNCSD